MSFQISPEIASNWQLISTVNKAAVETPLHKFHIPPFQIEGEFTSQFISVGIQVTPSGTNWRFGGYLSQEFDFEASTYLEPNKTFYKTADLEINNVTLVQMPILTEKPYRLRFFPPSWFRSLKLEVWEYKGAVVNTEVGGGIGKEELVALQELITARFDENKVVLGEIVANNMMERLELLTQVKQIDAGIYTLAEGIAELLPPQQGQSFKDTAERRLELDLGFL